MKPKILFITDDIRMPSGVGIQARKFITGLQKTNKYDIVCIAGSVTPQNPQPFLFENIKMYPTADGYGNPNLVRMVMSVEKPDIVVAFSDPRFFAYLFFMDDEIRQHAKLIFYHTWDNAPFPKFNLPWYASCDEIVMLSKFSYDLMTENEVDCHFIPHGMDSNEFYPVPAEARRAERDNIAAQAGVKDKMDFIIFWNNRNINRKRPGDVVNIFREFSKKHPKVLLMMNTVPVDREGTDLIAVTQEVNKTESPVVFNFQRLSSDRLNILYNAADVTINIAYCFPAGEKIITGNGVKPIEKIKVGDKVITHKGRYQSVTKLFKRKLNKDDLYTIHSSNNVPVTLTKEHPILAIKKDKVNFFIKEKLDKLEGLSEWINASDLRVGDYVVFRNLVDENIQDSVVDVFDFMKDVVGPIGRTRKFVKTYSADDTKVYLGSVEAKRCIGSRFLKLDNNLAYLLGLWCADGTTNTTRISLDKKYPDLIEKVVGVYESIFGGCKVYDQKTCTIVMSLHDSLYSAMFNKLCGRYCKNKQVPEIILSASNELKKAFVEGLLDGDGCIIHNKYTNYDYFRCRTISTNLMVGLKMLLISIGYCPTIKLEDNSKGFSKGKIWCIEWRDRQRGNNGSCRSWNIGNSIVSRINKIEVKKNQSCNVYNFEVEKDNSYSTLAFTVHNCEGFGLCVAESLMAGTPVIATKTGGMTTQLTDGKDTFGWLLEPAVQELYGVPGAAYIFRDYVSKEQVLNALEEAYEMKKEGSLREVGLKGRDYIQKTYPIENTVKLWGELLDESLAKPSLFKRWRLSIH